MEPASKRRKTTAKPKRVFDVKSFTSDWSELVPGKLFHVSFIQTGEEGDAREYRALFSSAEAARRFWTFAAHAEKFKAGSCPRLMSYLVDRDCDEKNRPVLHEESEEEYQEGAGGTGACASDAINPQNDLIVEAYVNLVAVRLLSDVKWKWVDPLKANYGFGTHDNLHVDWNIVSPECPIDAIFRTTNFC